MKTLIIIPTYNERENISQIIPAIFQNCPDVHVLVVDDNSPDKTADVVKSMQASDVRIHLLQRQEKNGLGRAYCAGFDWAFANGYDWIVQMDADFSHRPVDLKRMLESRDKGDFIVGSRYVNGGTTVNWGLIRKIISRGGGIYARTILGYPIRDWTAGFIAWNRKVLESIGTSTLKSNGYSFQIELKYRASKNGFKVYEVPITFEDRQVGQSKMSARIMIEALYRVWLLKFASI